MVTELKKNRGTGKVAAIFALLGVILFPLLGRAAITKGPYLVNPAQTSIRVMWECDNNQEAEFDYGSNAHFYTLTRIKPFDHKKELYLYRVEIENLKADTKYNYRVKTKDGFEANAFFKTLPPANSPVTFAAIGDSRTGHDIYKKMSLVLDDYSPGLIISMGDLVGTGKNFDEWGPHYFQPAADLIDRIPLISTLGDHDARGDDAENFFYYFRPSKTKEHIWFSFDYGPAHFVSLDYRDERNPDMVEWFKKDLGKCQAKWRFVYLHRPTYNTGGHRTNWGRGLWPELYSQYKVDIVFAGHSHMYERFYPLRPSKKADAWPVTYITTGGAGADLYESVPNPDLAKTASVNHFILVHLNGDTLELKTHRMDKSILDEFKIVKRNGHLGPSYLTLVKPQEDMDVYMLFASRAELRFHQIPGRNVAARADISFGPSDIEQDISFKVKLSPESARYYRMNPIAGVLKKGEKFDGTIKLYARGAVAINGRYFDPPVVFVVEYHTASSSGKAIGRQSRYYPPKN